MLQPKFFSHGHGRIRLTTGYARHSVRFTHLAPAVYVNWCRFYSSESGEWQVVPFGEDISLRVVTDGHADITMNPPPGWPVD